MFSNFLSVSSESSPTTCQATRTQNKIQRTQPPSSFNHRSNLQKLSLLYHAHKNELLDIQSITWPKRDDKLSTRLAILRELQCHQSTRGKRLQRSFCKKRSIERRRKRERVKWSDRWVATPLSSTKPAPGCQSAAASVHLAHHFDQLNQWKAPLPPSHW